VRKYQHRKQMHSSRSWADETVCYFDQVKVRVWVSGDLKLLLSSCCKCHSMVNCKCCRDWVNCSHHHNPTK